MEPTGTALGAQDLSIGYPARGRKGGRLYGALSLALRSGELTCLLGPNGAGKSTLLRTLGGLQRPLEGRVTWQGRPLERYGARERSRLLGVVLTDRSQAGGLRVRELVEMGRYPYTGFFGRLDAADRRAADEAIEAVGMTAKADSYVAELSDGERQKAMIAKTLAQQCPVILLDEPTAFLDVASRIEIMELLHRLARLQHKTVLLSTHDVEQALRLSDRIWLLSRAEGFCCGTPEDLVLSGRMDLYFGRGGLFFDRQAGDCAAGRTMLPPCGSKLRTRLWPAGRRMRWNATDFVRYRTAETNRFRSCGFRRSIASSGTGPVFLL